MRLLPAQQTSFTSGELAETLFGRIDVSRYFAGAQLLENVLVVPQGGVKRRPGMRHLAELDDGLDGVRAIPFAFNTEQTYTIVLTAGKFRVWRSDGTLLTTVTGAPWTASQAAQMNRAQSADTLLLMHQDMVPQRIRRGVLETSWTLDAIPFTNIPNFDFGSGPEPVMSATRGWPQALTFYQARLWFGGFRSAPPPCWAARWRISSILTWAPRSMTRRCSSPSTATRSTASARWPPGARSRCSPPAPNLR